MYTSMTVFFFFHFSFFKIHFKFLVKTFNPNHHTPYTIILFYSSVAYRIHIVIDDITCGRRHQTSIGIYRTNKTSQRWTTFGYCHHVFQAFLVTCHKVFIGCQYWSVKNLKTIVTTIETFLDCCRVLRDHQHSYHYTAGTLTSSFISFILI